MKNKIILLTSGQPYHSNVQEFVEQISRVKFFGGHINLFAKDLINFYQRFTVWPNSIGELQAFVVDRLGLDAEAYLNDEGRYKDEGGILIKQVTPLKFLYEYGNQAEAECCYATEPGEGSGKFQDVKIECNCKLVTSSPTVMREILERRLNLSLS